VSLCLTDELWQCELADRSGTAMQAEKKRLTATCHRHATTVSRLMSIPKKPGIDDDAIAADD
jgi:hypothetical protein